MITSVSNYQFSITHRQYHFLECDESHIDHLWALPSLKMGIYLLGIIEGINHPYVYYTCFFWYIRGVSIKHAFFPKNKISFSS